MANLTPPTSLWTVSTSVNGDTLTWLLPCGITWWVWQEQEFFYLFICHILLQLSHVLDWDTFCCVFSWSQWVKSRHTTILQTPEIPSNAPARWEACWLKCDLSGRLCTSTVNKVGGLEYCAFQEHPYIFTKVNSFPPSTTAAPRTVSLVPAWLAAVLAVTGLLTGWLATWILLSCITRRKKRLTLSAVELKSTSF